MCQFTQAFAAHATIRELVLGHLDKGDADILRQVNRTTRVAVNHNVTTVVCGLETPRFDTELASVFPGANKLHVVVMRGAPSTEMHICVVLEYISATSPALLARLEALTLRLGTIASCDEITAAVARFLSRCTSLQALDVEWQDDEDASNSLHFKGAGHTPQERRASMQCQLSALCSSTDFMAPESWPTHSCLTSLTMQSVSREASDTYLLPATRTPSLASLNFCVSAADLCAPLSDLSSLQSLTRLELSSFCLNPGSLNTGVLEAIAQLRNLQQLDIAVDMLAMDFDGEGANIPASWSALASLTGVVLAPPCDAFANQALAVTQLHRLAAVESLQLDGFAAVGEVSCLFALTRLTSLDGPSQFISPDGELAGEGAGNARQPAVPPQWRDRLQHLCWHDSSRSSIFMLPQLTSLTSLRLDGARISPQLCRVLDKMPHLEELCVLHVAEPDRSHLTAGAASFCPVLHAMKTIRLLDISGTTSAASLHVLARWTQIPADTKLESFGGLPATAHVAIKDWGHGWLPSVLACKSTCTARLAAVAVDDSDIDHYLSAVASMNQSQDSSHVLVLGTRVTADGFSRLLSCVEQPPLKLEIRPLESAQRGPYILKWMGPLVLTLPHLTALVGVSAQRLVSLMLSDCGQLSNRDVALLMGACHALKEVRLLGASQLGDQAFHSLAAGCKQLEQVQLTLATVTDQGVVVALAMLRGLQRLVLGAASMQWLESLKSLVQPQLGAAACLRWVAEGPSLVGSSRGAEASITWRRDLGGQ